MTVSPSKPVDKYDSLKKGFVVLLAIVLGFVVYLQRSNSSTIQNVGTTENPPSRKAGGSSAANSIESARWPEISLPEILAVSPFGRPPVKYISIQTQDAESLDNQLADEPKSPTVSIVPGPISAPIEAKRNDSLQAIVRTGNGYAALMNSKIVRTGDVLDGNIRVVEINDRGVVLETIKDSIIDSDK